MSTVANIYDNGPLSPVARIMDTISVYTAKKWGHYRITFLEPWPRSSPLVADMVALTTVATGATVIAANGTLNKLIVAIVQVTDGEMLLLRYEPLDDVEGVLWEQAGVGRFNSRNAHARVGMQTHLRDPYLATSTFYVMGYNRDINLEVRNPNPIALVQARFQFWGYRHVLSEIEPDFPANFPKPEQESIKRQLANGDKDVVAKYIGPTTWLPAEGV